MLLTELANYIITQDPTRVLDDNLFTDIMPPDDAVTGNTVLSLFKYGGHPSEPDMGTRNMRLVFPLVQAMCRGVANDRNSPELALQGIIGMFTAVVAQSLGGVYYLAIEALGEPSFLNRDENFRTSFVVNFKVTKRYSAT